MNEECLERQRLNYRVRRATLNDVALIAYQRASMFRDMGVAEEAEASSIQAGSQSYLAGLMTSDEYLGWLTESGDTVVAGGGILLRHLLPRPKNINGGYEAHILNIYTEAAHRRRGLARQLMIAMMDWCRQQKLERISLHASEAGLLLYQSLGFNPTNELRFEL